MDYHLTSIPDKAFAEDYRKALLEGRDVSRDISCSETIRRLIQKGLESEKSGAS